jgi:energy-coupling factor transporter ATP-binding protein EcfA2
LQEVYVDGGYRTRLGIRFYDRVEELDTLREHVEALPTVVVYGPRGAGKSELVRYLVLRRLEAPPAGVVLVDGVERRVEGLLGLPVDVKGVVESLLDVLGTPGGLVRLAEGLVRAAVKPSLVVIDELHMFFDTPIEALRALEALAGYLAKRGVRRPKLIVTTSEGLIATVKAAARLAGYAVGFTLVEHMDPTSFTMLYREYSGKYGCRLSLDELMALAGTLPGYLPDLCPRSPQLLHEWIRERLSQLAEALAEAAEALGISPKEAEKLALELLKGKRVELGRELRLAERLVEANIAYPCRGKPAILPQLPVYLSALETVQREGISLYDLDPELLTRSKPKLLRCGGTA